MSTAPLPFLEQKTITFDDGTSLELGDAITDFRQCHDEFEKRILYHCRRPLPPSSSPPERISSKVDDDDLIVKIKVQIPDPDSPTTKTTSSSSTTTTPASPPLPPGHPGSDTYPSWSTMREFQALRNITHFHCHHAPHLVFLDTLLQGPDDPLPGGYINFLVMSRLPGKSLFDLGYWSLEAGARKAIQEGFLEALWAVREVDIEPDDKGLRNVMWDGESGSCALVDFEMWQNWSGCKNEVGDVESEEGQMEDLRRWGLASRPPAKNWWAEFGIETR